MPFQCLERAFLADCGLPGFVWLSACASTLTSAQPHWAACSYLYTVRHLSPLFQDITTIVTASALFSPHSFPTVTLFNLSVAAIAKFIGLREPSLPISDESLEQPPLVRSLPCCLPSPPSVTLGSSKTGEYTDSPVYPGGARYEPEHCPRR